MRYFLLIAALVALGCSDDRLYAYDDPTTGSGANGGGGAGGGAGGAGGGGAGGSGGGGGMSTSVPLAGLGEITGDCGEIDPDELVAGSDGFILSNELDFGSADFDDALLSVGGMKLFNDPNLGGSSKFSEIFAYEMLYRCELAGLLKSEAEILYDVEGKKTDILVTVDDAKVGVSVVRAYTPNPVYTTMEAEALLTGKLSDILESTDNVAPGDSWGKQILHVVAYEPQHLMAIQEAFPLVDASVRADTIVVVTLTSGNDEFIYSE